MKLLYIASLLLLLNTSYAETQKIELQNATISEFIKFCSDHLDESIVVGDTLKSDISLYAKYESKAKLKQLLLDVVRSAGYKVNVKSDIILISKSGDIGTVPLNTRTIQLQNIPSTYALELIRATIATTLEREQSGFQVNESITNNSLVVTATETQHEDIKRLVSEIDIRRKQVKVEAVFAELSTEDFENIGANLLAGTKAIASLNTVEPSSILNGAAISFFSSEDIKAFITAVQSSTQSNILSQPRLIVLDREQGSMIVGQNVPFVTGSSTSDSSSTENPFQTIERKDVGLRLSVLPVIMPSGVIELKITQESSDVTDSTIASDIITNTRTIRTLLQLQDGQSVVMGGLKSTTSKDTSVGVPFLSKVPFLGRAFASKKQESTERVLTIIITATTV